jgi:hypothetical protein
MSESSHVMISRHVKVQLILKTADLPTLADMERFCELVRVNGGDEKTLISYESLTGCITAMIIPKGEQWTVGPEVQMGDW